MFAMRNYVQGAQECHPIGARLQVPQQNNHRHRHVLCELEFLDHRTNRHPNADTVDAPPPAMDLRMSGHRGARPTGQRLRDQSTDHLATRKVQQPGSFTPYPQVVDNEWSLATGASQGWPSEPFYQALQGGYKAREGVRTV